MVEDGHRGGLAPPVGATALDHGPAAQRTTFQRLSHLAAPQKGVGAPQEPGTEAPPRGRESTDSRAKYTKLKARTAFPELFLSDSRGAEGAGGWG